MTRELQADAAQKLADAVREFFATLERFKGASETQVTYHTQLVGTITYSQRELAASDLQVARMRMRDMLANYDALIAEEATDGRH